jgi:hypothetical protein
MEQSFFMESARHIAKRNVNSHVAFISASFDEIKRHLFVTYYTRGTPTEEDWEECELTCGEILAAFPEIKTAETKCCSVDSHAQGSLKDVVFPA